MISSKETTSVISIGLEDFEKQVIQENRPVLLLCAYRDLDYQKQLDIMEGIYNSYGEGLVMCVLEEEFIKVFMERYNIKGTPTFLIFVGGCEKGRMLGQADPERLRDFVLETLVSCQS